MNIRYMIPKTFDKYRYSEYCYDPPTHCSHGVSPVTRGVTGQIVLELGSNTAARGRWPIDPGAD